MNINVITPFPAMFDSVLNQSILLKAKQKNIVEYNVFNLFDFLDNPSQRIDDYPFGGGEGMLLKPEPIFNAVGQIKNNLNDEDVRVVFPTPDGTLFEHKKAKELSEKESLIFICGHYKGIDQRISDEIVTDEITLNNEDIIESILDEEAILAKEHEIIDLFEESEQRQQAIVETDLMM